MSCSAWSPICSLEDTATVMSLSLTLLYSIPHADHAVRYVGERAMLTRVLLIVLAVIQARQDYAFILDLRFFRPILSTTDGVLIQLRSYRCPTSVLGSNHAGRVDNRGATSVSTRIVIRIWFQSAVRLLLLAHFNRVCPAAGVIRLF